MLTVGDPISFGERKGTVVRLVHLNLDDNEPGLFYIVKLDADSQGYLEPIDDKPRDCFISVMLVHVGNEDSD